VIGMPERDCVNVNDDVCRRIGRINHAELARNELDATFFGSVGDGVCPCRFWRPLLQNLCQCGLMARAIVTPDRTPLSGIRGRSVAVETRDESMRACVSGDETVEYNWIDWICDAQYAGDRLQRYQAGCAVVPQDKQTQIRGGQKSPSGARANVTPRPILRSPTCRTCGWCASICNGCNSRGACCDG
jgi:hypothetical protein